MALPTISVPKYETTLPSTGKKVTFRPFLVKEEKILLLAMETGDTKAQNKAIKQILSNCVEDDISIDSMPVFDVEHLFIQIRGKSVGEVLEPVVVCPNCSLSGKIKVDLSGTQVNMDSNYSSPYRVMITDTLGLTMVYPTIQIAEAATSALGNKKTDTETVFSILAKCIDMIFDGEKTYDPKTYSAKEINEFMESITSEPFTKMVEFITNIPRVEKSVHFKCPKCSHEQDIVLRGIQDFFGSVSPTIA